MGNELSPMIGQWYQYVASGELLRVVAIDELDGLIEVQKFDGNLEEVDQETWHDLDIQLAEPPDDWTGPYDDADLEESYDSTQGELAADWRIPVDQVESADDRWEEIPSLNEAEIPINSVALTSRG
jgi:hypothetical protein